MSKGKIKKVDFVRVRGFESLSLRSESCFNSGFHSFRASDGQNIGQNTDLIFKEMATAINPIPYKLAKVYMGPNEHFVRYSFYSLTQKKYCVRKVRLGYRKVPDSELKLMLQKLCNDINEIIIQRNNQWIYHEQIKNPDKVFSASNTLIQSLEYVARQSMISENRKREIADTILALSSWFLDAPEYENYSAEDYETDDLQLFAHYLTNQLHRLGKTINKYLAQIEFCTEYLHKKGKLDKVLMTKDVRIKHSQNESQKYTPLTNAEKKAAFDYFNEKNTGYHLFLYFIYYTCIRPKEIHRLQLKHIDLSAGTIYVPWYNSKNGVSNYVQILGPLLQKLKALNWDGYSSEIYLFGQNFQPSPTLYQGDYSSKYWYKHRERIGLPKEKTPYGLKHTFNVDYIENNKDNINWEWLRRHNRHATVQQTQQYISGLTAYFLDETKSIILDYNR
jgi:integrase